MGKSASLLYPVREAAKHGKHVDFSRLDHPDEAVAPVIGADAAADLKTAEPGHLSLLHSLHFFAGRCQREVDLVYPDMMRKSLAVNP